MRIIYSKSHTMHDPTLSPWDGLPSLEVSCRAESIREALAPYRCHEWREPHYEPDHWIAKAHSPELICFLRGTSRQPERIVRREERQDVILESDPGIVVTQGAYYASKAAAACAVSGVDLLNGGDNMVYSLCRPPGHHASSGKMGGYCYFNNAAIAAGMLRNAGKRVAILDIDFHHGNGTQDIFFDDDGTLYASINCIGAYPHHAGSALVDERHSAEVGADGRHNHIANFNLPSEIGETGYDAAFEAARLRIKDFKPDVLIVSAGFDTSAGERKDLEDVKPFGLTEAFYRHMGNVLGGVTIGGADLPILVVQEGGYNPAQLGRDVWSFLDGMERVRRTFTGHVRSSPRHAQIQS